MYIKYVPLSYNLLTRSRETIFLDYVFQSTSSVFRNFLKNIQDFIMKLAICNLIILFKIRVGNSRSASDMESH